MDFGPNPRNPKKEYVTAPASPGLAKKNMSRPSPAGRPKKKYVTAESARSVCQFP